ncbi:MAG: DUF1592 domain-containing protein [Verrucomicrobiales bacterium]|nr:DUF1592 domain-containing protein [Verrucomicrobiales bacterium]
MKLVSIGIVFVAALLVVSCAERRGLGLRAGVPSGAAIYRKQCARCHGTNGEGVADKYDEPLYGNRSPEALTRLIERTMPEDKPGTCVGENAKAVAAYIYDAFYSPEARSRNNPPKVDLARLTNRQYRESVADLIGSFRPVQQTTNTGGLRAEYFQSKGMNKKDKRVVERVDERIDFDFGLGSPAYDISADQFSIAWAGSILAPETGPYEFRLTTPNGARLYLNTDLAAGDSNRRDDSDAKRQATLIDLWVSSGSMVREGAAQVFLLGGRSYPLRLDYFKFKEKTASVKFEWKPPHGVWEVVPGTALSPESSSSIAVISTPFPPDDGSFGYERGTSVSKAWHEATTKAAVEAAGQIEARLNVLADTRDNATNRTEQLRAFASAFAERAFRRPLTPELREAIIERQFAAGLAPETAVKRVVMLVLKSPRFLYPDLAQTTDHYTVAARLALALWDSLPDQPLLETAARGELGTPLQTREQAKRMMQDLRARAKLKEFFHHWLAVEEAEDISKDPKTYPGFNESFVADLRGSLEKFVEHVVWSDRSDYRELLLADYLFLNPRLASFYGADEPEGEEFTLVKFDPAERAGVFTHPFLLSAFSYHKSSSPIHRGVFLTRNVLGRFLKPPPMAIEFMDDRFDPSLTMREKVAELTGKPACMACHATINPLGFSLENYDAAGRFRTTDNNKPVNAESDYTTTEGQTIRLRGPRDLAQHASASAEARQGFVRQMFQQSIKQAPAAYGPDALKRLDAAFVESGFHIRNLQVEVAVLAATHGMNKQQLAANP